MFSVSCITKLMLLGKVWLENEQSGAFGPVICYFFDKNLNNKGHLRRFSRIGSRFRHRPVRFRKYVNPTRCVRFRRLSRP